MKTRPGPPWDPFWRPWDCLNLLIADEALSSLHRCVTSDHNTAFDLLCLSAASYYRVRYASLYCSEIEKS